MNNSSSCRRRHERFCLNSGTIIYNWNVFGNLIDISDGGLSFTYSRDHLLMENVDLELNIMCNDPMVYIPEIHCHTVSNVTLDNIMPTNDNSERRLSVQFNLLTDEQKSLLKQLVATQTA